MFMFVRTVNNFLHSKARGFRRRNRYRMAVSNKNSIINKRNRRLIKCLL